jgi:choline dehydrogenase-like flavoprotein
MAQRNTGVSLNIQAKKLNTFDVIVIGSGMSGGWAAKEFCEKGLKTLVLERGRNVEHIKDYPTALTPPWEFPHRNTLTRQLREDNPIVSRCYAFEESTQHFFVKDNEHPYEQTRPFDWIRGYQVGGRSLLWGRMTQRLSDLDFEANVKEGVGTDWPIRYKDLAPWYSYVEKFVGISGNRDGIAHLPDGEFLPAMELNPLEKHFKSTLASTHPDRHLIAGRNANLSVPHLGRGPCQKRNLCFRGCPFGGYFSSNSATLPAAEKTGNLTLRPFSVVHSIIYDEATEKATGVRVIDANTKESIEYFAKIVFVNGSTLNSTLILLNSTSSRFPNGMGNDSGELGHNLMDHNYNGRIRGEFDGLDDLYFSGRRPSSAYIPRFRNVDNDKQSAYTRGFAYAFHATRDEPNVADAPLGVALKQKLGELSPWKVQLVGMGECLPSHDNKVTLSKDKQDEWGIPLLNMDAAFGDNERAMLTDILESGKEMLEKTGFTNVSTKTVPDVIGLHNHEMGTARMGTSSKNSVVNAHNQVWGAANVFVTDGAAMTSGGCQNPSLTYMALTARAANFAVEELKKHNL